MFCCIPDVSLCNRLTRRGLDRATLALDTVAIALGGPVRETTLLKAELETVLGTFKLELDTLDETDEVEEIAVQVEFKIAFVICVVDKRELPPGACKTDWYCGLVALFFVFIA